MGLLPSGSEVCLEQCFPFQQKIILNIFWPDVLMRAVADKIQEENDGREKEFNRIGGYTYTPGINRRNYGGDWRSSSVLHEDVGRSQGGDYSHGGIDSPRAGV